MSAATATPGLTHLGLLYDAPDDLVDLVVPHLGSALDRGDAVATLVDRRTTRELREALGERRDLTFASPHDVGTARPEVLLRRLREVVGATPGRRSTILTQYSAFPTAEGDVVVGESGINLVLADLPLTMVCACPRDAGPALLDATHHAHPAWLDGAGTTDNPRFRPPQDRSPTASTVWGGVHALRLCFGRTEDLARIRTHVAALAAEVGLRGEPAQCAVLAVHEAAVVACDDAADARGDAPCVLDAWTAGGRLVVEVRGPRGSSAQADPAGDEEARLPRNRLRVAGPLRVARAFCRDLTVREAHDGRVVRVVSP